MACGNARRYLGAPRRCAVCERRRGGRQSGAVVARGVQVSRPAVSQHLKALKEAGLVADRPEGTRRVYYIDPHGLGELRRWLDQFWDDALEAFKKRVESPHSSHKRKTP